MRGFLRSDPQTPPHTAPTPTPTRQPLHRFYVPLLPRPLLLVGAVGVVIGPEPPLGPAVSMVLVGVFAGSVGWWIVLSAMTSALRGRLTLAVIQGINRAAAVGMVSFAALSLVRILGG